MTNPMNTDTGQKIIEAAFKIIAEQGYDKASMKEIAKEAGVSQGLINYYFPSKNDLLFALFKEETIRFSAEMRRIMESGQSPKDNIRHVFRTLKELVTTHPELFRLRYELFAFGLRNEQGRGKIAESLTIGRDTSISLLGLIQPCEADSYALSSLIIAAVDGLSLQYLTDPEFDLDAAYDLLTDFLTKLTEKRQEGNRNEIGH